MTYEIRYTGGQIDGGYSELAHAIAQLGGALNLRREYREDIVHVTREDDRALVSSYSGEADVVAVAWPNQAAFDADVEAGAGSGLDRSMATIVEVVL